MIGVIFTGGTIGSSVQGEYIESDPDKKYVLLEKYQEQYGKKDFVTACPYEILSENLEFKNLALLYNKILEIKQGLDGIIITHGSDTIQYTAAFLSYVLQDDMPVMIVCSNYVLEDSRANGLRNFADACDFIEKAYGNGVFVPYNGKIHYGNALLPHDSYSDELRSYENAVYGSYIGGRFEPSGVKPPFSIKKIQLTANPDFAHKIMAISPVPGIIYPKPSGVKAVLLYTYHSGTLATDSPELKEFTDAAYLKNIPVYVSGITSDMDYASSKKYNELHLIPMEKVSDICAYVKIWLKFC